MNRDFRFNVLTRHKMGLSAADSHIELVAVHGDASPNERTVFRWISDILNGRLHQEKRTSPGRPIVTCTTAAIRKVKRIKTQNSWLSCTDIALRLSLPNTFVFDILTKNLNLRNVHAFWVPHFLSERNKTAWVACCRALLELFNTKGLHYIGSNYVIEDKPWFLWSQKYKGRVWIGKKGPKPTDVTQS